MSNFGFHRTQMPWAPVSLAREIQNFQQVSNKGKPQQQQQQQPSQPRRRGAPTGVGIQTGPPMMVQPPPLRRQQQPIQPTRTPQIRMGMGQQSAGKPGMQSRQSSIALNAPTVPLMVQQKEQDTIGMPNRTSGTATGQQLPPGVEMNDPLQQPNHSEIEKLCKQHIQKGLADQEKQVQELLLGTQRQKEEYVQIKHFMMDSTQKHLLLKEELRKYVEGVLKEKIDRKGVDGLIKDEITKQVHDLQKVLMNEVTELDTKRQILEMSAVPIQAQVTKETQTHEKPDGQSKIVKTIQKGATILLRGQSKEANGEKWQETFDVDAQTGKMSRSWIRNSEVGQFKLI
jgi:hypothetical protein